MRQSAQLKQQMSLRKELNMSQLLRANILSLPPKALDFLINLVVTNPEKADAIIRNKSKHRKGVINALYDGFGAVAAKNLKPLEKLVDEDAKVECIPDVVYIGRKNDRPKIIFSETLIKKPQLSLAQIPREYQEARNIFGFLMYEREWITDVLKRIYTIIGDAQREFIYNPVPVNLNKFELADLAEKMDLHVSTVGRLRNGRYIVIENDKSVVLPVHFLMPNDDSFRKYNEIEKINLLLAEESPQAYSDAKLSANLNIARRTVTKYRKEYGIPESRERAKAYQKDSEKRYQIEIIGSL
jgi:DNA-directed RNA polymerase specialized sigma54-like protein